MEKYEIQKLRDLPIEKVAEQMGMKVEHHKALCPFHDDHHASLSFNKAKNSCRCYVCMGNSLGTIDLAMKYLGKDFLSACRWLAEEHQVQLEEDRKREASSSSSSLGGSSSGGSSPDNNSGGSSSEDNSGGSPSGKSSSFDAGRYARFFEHPWLNEAARRFLFEERKIDERVAAWCRLTSWTDRNGVNWLQIPYFNTEGKLIGIQNRNLDYKKGESTPRFRFPYGAKCSIYNLPIVRGIAPGESLFLQLKEILPSLVHHQLPPGCKDFSEYYLKEKIEFKRKD